jgi:hypothetical protein
MPEEAPVRVVEGCGLPPGVESMQRGILSLELSNLFWELRGAPTHPIAKVKWWGQKKNEELQVPLWYPGTLQVRAQELTPLR